MKSAVALLVMTLVFFVLAMIDLTSGLLRQFSPTVDYLGVSKYLLFISIVLFFVSGSTIHQYARLGYLIRKARKEEETPEEIEAQASDQASVVVLVPSYKEDELVIQKTLLSSALQTYPEKRIVLLIDDPTYPSSQEDKDILAQSRELPGKILSILKAPKQKMEMRQAEFQNRTQKLLVDWYEEVNHLCAAIQETQAWLASQAESYPVKDHTDEHFVHLTFRTAEQDLEVVKNRWANDARNEKKIEAQAIAQEYRMLVARFSAEITSFERKAYENLSHEPNKAMNLNSYLSIMGGYFQEQLIKGKKFLLQCEAKEASLAFGDSKYVLILDADSIVHPDYASRLVRIHEKSGNERIAVVQTPYNTFPKAKSILETIAGATTDIQYLVHQGFTHFGSSFWVGANAVVRKAALEDISIESMERGHKVKQFIHDLTVNEDTESSIHFVSKGWSIHNHLDRLAFSATPPDFGSLLIQRRRWANGGLIVLPNYMRHLANTLKTQPPGISEVFLRLHYLTSMATVTVGLLVMILFSFSECVQGPWLPLTALPYYIIFASDLKEIGYKWIDVFNVYSLNILLMPVHLGGVVRSIFQIVTGQKTAFARTPKVPGRTAVPALYVISEFAILAYLFYAISVDLVEQKYVHACVALFNTALLFYGILRFMGLRDSASDIQLAWTHSSFRSRLQTQFEEMRETLASVAKRAHKQDHSEIANRPHLAKPKARPSASVSATKESKRRILAIPKAKRAADAHKFDQTQ